MIGAGGDAGPFRRSARLQGEEARSAPGRAGDGPGDCRQAGIEVSLPDIAVGPDRDGVAPALIVADQHGADLEVTLGWAGAIAAGEAVQEFERGTVECAKRFFLNPVGD